MKVNMSQLLAKLKNPLVMSVIGLLLVASIVLVTVLYLTANHQQPKPKLVSPKAVQKVLNTANDTAKDEFDTHNSADQALSEQQVKLAE